MKITEEERIKRQEQTKNTKKAIERLNDNTELNERIKKLLEILPDLKEEE
jgi:hypothetical protein